MSKFSREELELRREKAKRLLDEGVSHANAGDLNPFVAGLLASILVELRYISDNLIPGGDDQCH